MSLVVDIEKKLGSFTLRSQFETDSGTMALLGASGCGKSVTLKCIAGIMTPDRGRIVLNGRTLFDSEQQAYKDAEGAYAATSQNVSETYTAPAKGDGSTVLDRYDNVVITVTK